MILSLEIISVSEKANHLLRKYELFVPKYDLSEEINYLLRNSDFIDRQLFFFEKQILEAGIRRWMEATGGNGGQFPRTDFGPACQI